MRLLTGDECGLIKEIIPELKSVQRIDPSVPQKRANGILGLEWIEPQKQFAALRNDGGIDCYSYENNNKTNEAGTYTKIDSVSDLFEDSSVPLLKTLGYTQNRLVVANSVGHVVVAKTDSVVARYSAHVATTAASISYTKGQYDNTQLATCMTVNNEGRIAIGGRERETLVLDIETGHKVWKAKNLAPDPQTLLQQPIWPTALLFVNPHTLVTGTAYKQVRLYDLRSNSRRPQSYTPEGLFAHRITTLCATNDDKTIVVGDSAGYLNSIELSKLKQQGQTNLPRFVGPVGSVRDMQKHPNLKMLASVGLDRMLRIYSTDSRKQLHCIYLKQRLNNVLWFDDGKVDVLAAATTEASSTPEQEEEYPVDGDPNEEDEVQDYVDSDEEGGEEEDADESDSDDDVDSDDDSDDDDEGESSDDSDDDAEQLFRRITKKQRR